MLNKATISNNQIIKLAFLKTGLLALGISGAYSILIVLLRTPFINQFLPKEFFKSALIIHVDLSVLIWLLSFASFLWINFTKLRFVNYARSINYLYIAAIILMAISPFIGDHQPFMNNYVPILHNISFVIGLSLFLTANLIITCLFIINNTANIAVKVTAYINLLAYIIFIGSYYKLKQLLLDYPIDLHHYFELLFWGGGHIWQFLFTQMLMISWWLITNNNFELNNKLKLIFTLNLIFILPSPIIFWLGNLDDGSYTNFFTNQMKYFGGVAPSILFIYIIFKADNFINKTAAHLAVYSSMILFFSGGIISLFIDGVNAIIPAHYHGSIVGVTLAIMAYYYHYLTKFNITFSKAAILQPVIYASGQLLHIFGLAWSGGYGALRKTPGEMLTVKAKIAMGIMGFGGLIAIIGGLMFFIICVKNFPNHQKITSNDKTN